MDEYIARNYLSVAGVSYYQSDEFRHLGLEMDPISRFGIGILSCFMVARQIGIETRREPQMSGDSEPLLFDIPAVDRQFRIYRASNDTPVGTAVTVHVVGAKLKGDIREKNPAEQTSSNVRLQVTEYLSQVAGFVEFPIIIDEDGKRTVILHPARPVTDADEFRSEGVAHEVRQLTTEYPWDEAFEPQDSELAQTHLRQQSFDLKLDLGLMDYEGTISYVKPVSNEAIFRSGYRASHNAIEISIKERDSWILRVKQAWLDRGQKKGLSPSSLANHSLSIYRDGILVADAGVTRHDTIHFLYQWPIPMLRVNLSKRIGGDVDVTRRALTDTVSSWDAPIWRGVVDHLRKHDIIEALDREPSLRLELLGKLTTVFHLTDVEISELVPYASWPLPMLVATEGALVLDNQLVFGQITRTAPDMIKDEVGKALYGKDGQEAVDFLKLWRGSASIAVTNRSFRASLGVEFWVELSERILKSLLAPAGVRFLWPPYPGLPCLPQNEFQCIRPSDIPESDLMERTMLDPLSLDLPDLCALRHRSPYRIRDILAAAPFSSPFECFFIGEGSVPNRRHPTTVALLRCFAAVRWHQLKRSRQPVEIGRALDQFELVASRLHSRRIEASLDSLWAVVKQGRFLDFEPPPPLSDRDIIPVSESSRHMRRAMNPRDEGERRELAQLREPHLRPFGQPVEKVEPEDAPPDIIEAMAHRL